MCYVDAAKSGCRYDDGFWLWGWLPIRQSREPYPSYLALDEADVDAVFFFVDRHLLGS